MAPLLAWADASESSLSGAGHGESQELRGTPSTRLILKS